jgi:hypothetical protein
VVDGDVVGTMAGGGTLAAYRPMQCHAKAHLGGGDSKVAVG